jgi:hypothetical protein
MSETNGRIDKTLAALDRLDQQARDDARRNSEPPEPHTAERILADRLAAARSPWFTVDIERPSS